jgi:hypothetical protein
MRLRLWPCIIMAAVLILVSSGAGAQEMRPPKLVSQIGGEYFNLTRLSPDAVLPWIGAAPYAFISGDFDPNKIGPIYPQTSQPVAGRQDKPGGPGPAEAPGLFSQADKPRGQFQVPAA